MTTRTWFGTARGRQAFVVAPRPHPRRRLRVEALEDRTVPSDSHLTLELRPAAGLTSPGPVTIPINEFTFGFHNVTTIGSATGGAGAGKAKFDELDVRAPLSPDSPVLLDALVTGSHYDTAVLTERDAAGKPVAAWVLGLVFVTADAVDNDSAAAPTEKLSFVFRSVTEATSAHTTTWNQATNAAEGPGLPAGLILAPLPAPAAKPALTLELTPGTGSQPAVTIPLGGYTFGFHNPTTVGSGSGGAAAGRAKFDALEVTAPFGADSPLLLQALVSGSHYDTATLVQRDAAGDPVAAWALGDLILTDDAVTGAAEFPAEKLSFQFGSLTEATSAGATSWSQILNTPGGPGLPGGLTLAPLPAAPAAPAVTLDLTPELPPGPPVSIPLDGYAFGFHNTAIIGSATGGAGAGRAKFDALDVKAAFGPDSPALLKVLATGGHFRTAVLTQRDAAGKPVAVWALGAVSLTDDRVAGGAGLPAEGLTFQFQSLTEATSAGATSWSQATNAAGGPGLPAGLTLVPLPPGPAAPALTLELTPGAGSAPAVSIPLGGYTFGFHNTATIGSATGGAGAGKAKFDALDVKAAFGPDSPALLEALATGAHYDTATLVQRDSAGDPVAAWALGGVFLTGDAVTGGENLPAEKLSFQFGSLTEATSARTTSWSQVTNADGGPGLPAGLTLAPLPAGPAAPAVTLDLTPELTSDPPVSIPLGGYAFGFHNTGAIGSATTGTGAGKATFDALQVDTPFGPDSPALLRALAMGSHYGTAVLTQRDAAGKPVAAWALGTVSVAGDAITGGEGFPAERLTFQFWSATEATSAQTTSWSQVTNSADGPGLPAGLALAPLPAPPAKSTLTLELKPEGGSLAPAKFEIKDYSFGVENPTTIGSATTGAGAGKARFDALEVTAPFGADSPLLLKSLVTEAHYDTAVLVQRNVAGRPVAAWALGTVILTDDRVGGGDGLPAERLTFHFGSLTEATSAHTTSWSQVTNSAEGPAIPAGLTLVPVNDVAPTDIALSGAAVAENLPAGTPVGTFSTTDPDADDVFTYALVNGPGDTGNGSFALDAAGHLTTAAAFDFEAQSSYSIRVRTSDVAGLFVEKVFTISVLNVNEAPTVTGFTKVGAEDNTLAFAASDFTGHYGDPEGDPLAAVRIVSLPAGGVLRLNGTAVTAGQVIAAADLGRLAFVPALNFSGVVSFRYTASDGALFAAAPATITLDIRSAAQQAATLNQTIQGLVTGGKLTRGQGQALTITLHGNSGDAGKVRAFLNQLNAFLRAGILTPAQYAGLYQAGQALLASVLAR